MADGPLVQMMKFFGYPSVAAFSADWKRMSDKDKDELKSGFENGSLTY